MKLCCNRKPRFRSEMPKESEASGRTLGEGSYLFDDLEIGDNFSTGSIEVTAAIIRDFAELSGDSYALHLDDEFALGMGFPELIAHGILVMALADGLKFRSPVKLAAIASLGWDIRYTAPVFAGDRISAAIAVEGNARPAGPIGGSLPLDSISESRAARRFRAGLTD